LQTADSEAHDTWLTQHAPDLVTGAVPSARFAAYGRFAKEGFDIRPVVPLGGKRRWEKVWVPVPKDIEKLVQGRRLAREERQ
jgi:hypothetical protein